MSALCYVTIKNNSKTQFLDSTKKLTNKTELNINVIRLELKEWKSCFGKMLLNELKMKKMVYVNCIICTWEYSIIVCIYGQLTSLIFRIQTREIQRTKISLLLKSTSVSRFHYKKSITTLCQIYLFIIYFQFIYRWQILFYRTIRLAFHKQQGLSQTSGAINNIVECCYRWHQIFETELQFVVLIKVTCFSQKLHKEII